VFNGEKIAQKRLRDLKGKISAQSKKNFVLERDVRYLDSRIALLIQNRMALDEVSSPAKHLFTSTQLAYRPHPAT
jgi:Ras GTPase-activating-like protein IQGAP2/3